MRDQEGPDQSILQASSITLDPKASTSFPGLLMRRNFFRLSTLVRPNGGGANLLNLGDDGCKSLRTSHWLRCQRLSQWSPTGTVQSVHHCLPAIKVALTGGTSSDACFEGVFLSLQQRRLGLPPILEDADLRVFNGIKDAKDSSIQSAFFHVFLDSIASGSHEDLGALFIQRETAIFRHSFNGFLLDLTCGFEIGWSSGEGGAWSVGACEVLWSHSILPPMQCHLIRLQRETRSSNSKWHGSSQTCGSCLFHRSCLFH
jgi:hypothetical protein